LDLLRFISKAVRSVWVLLALPLMAISFYALLILLSWAPISLVIPASAFSYVVGTLGAKYILKEEISPARWIGVIMVCIGVAIAAIG
jgi:drug/metabolite transporter (DMT)-like permease